MHGPHTAPGRRKGHNAMGGSSNKESKANKSWWQTNFCPPATPDGASKTSMGRGGVCQEGAEGGLLPWGWEEGGLGGTQVVIQNTMKDHVVCVLNQVWPPCALAVLAVPLSARPHRPAQHPLPLLQAPVGSRAQLCQAQAPLPLPHLVNVGCPAVGIGGEAAGPHSNKVVVQAGVPWWRWPAGT
jgi:hypothetical protein